MTAAALALGLEARAYDSIEPRVTYHDGVTQLRDTTITFPLDTLACRAVIETRAKLEDDPLLLRADARGWAMAWGDYPRRYYRAMLKRGRSGDDDVADSDILRLRISELADNVETRIVNEIEIYDNVDTGKGAENSMEIVIEPATGQTTIYVGNHQLYEVASETLRYPGGLTCWAIEAVAPIAVVTAVTEVGFSRKETCMTEWNRETLDSRFASSSDPIEGYWDFLDRDVDDRLARIGGRYRLALVGDGKGGYDIIYVDGAKVNGDDWKLGMRRGHLAKTIFSNHYDLHWVDSSFEEILHDAFADIEQGSILSMQFPIYGSKMRFSKVTF